MHITQFLPKSYLSWCLGALARLPLPWPLSEISIRIFAKVYGIDLTTATRKLREFSSIGEFFVRDVRPELRPVHGKLVSPVDGTVRSVEVIERAGTLLQEVKGVRYSLAHLVGDPSIAEIFIGGGCYNVYLSPSDAHHIHSPVDGEVVRTVHIPGKLWPVNAWAIQNVPNLFVVNERIVTLIKTDIGSVAVVMVGATNVGRIQLHYLDLVTNTRPWAHAQKRFFAHDPGVSIRRGEKVGTFHMGSSVILLTSPEYGPPAAFVLSKVGQKVMFGEALSV